MKMIYVYFWICSLMILVMWLQLNTSGVWFHVSYVFKPGYCTHQCERTCSTKCVLGVSVHGALADNFDVTGHYCVYLCVS
jgi:hypothetical protein